MSEKRVWIGIIGGTVLIAGGLGALIYFKQADIEQARQEVADLGNEIDSARATIRGTANLEREVIVLREIAEVIDEILPGTEDLNTLIDDFYQYAQDSKVHSTSFKRKPQRVRAGQESDFDKVSYTLTLEGGIFEYLAFLNRIETHSRFMSVPSFKITSTTRQQIARNGQALHRIQIDVETYTYSSKTVATAVGIEGYARKRDLLAGDINRRRKALKLATFHYRGERGRRDPWIDPRVPEVDGSGGPTVQEQALRVEHMAGLVEAANAKWAEVQASDNIIDQMVKKDELAKIVALLDEEIRRVESEDYITYVPAQRRLTVEVYEPREELRQLMEQDRMRGPRRAEMEQLIESMLRHIDSGEYDLALVAFNHSKPALDEVQGDPVREDLALELRELALEAETLRDFDAIEINFGGSVIIEGKPPVIIINGLSYGIGDVVLNEIEIADIREDEVDFYFRGFILYRSY